MSNAICDKCDGDGFNEVALGGNPDRITKEACDCINGRRWMREQFRQLERRNRESGPAYERAVDEFRNGER